MKVKQLFELISNLPSNYNNTNVYMQMKDESPTKTMDPELLQDVSEFVVDLEDDVIIIRSVYV